MTEFLVATIEANGIGAQQPLHAGHQVGLGCLDNQMKMIGHQAIGMHQPIGSSTRLVQSGNEFVTILVAQKISLRW